MLDASKPSVLDLLYLFLANGLFSVEQSGLFGNIPLCSTFFTRVLRSRADIHVAVHGGPLFGTTTLIHREERIRALECVIRNRYH